MNEAITLNVLTKEKYEKAESELLKHPQVDCAVVHSFGPGTYIRQVSIPKGTFSIGHAQKLEHTNIMLKGKVTMLNDDGSTTLLEAPQIFTGKPGRKIGFIHDDMVWLNVYPNIDNEQDIEKLEEKYLDKSDTFKLADESREKLLLSNRSKDEHDFDQMLLDLGMSKDKVQEQSENASDLTYLPHGSFKIKTAKSQIHGTGIFATGDHVFGEKIGPARIDGKRTILGRYTNHAKYPNAQFVELKDGNIDLIAIKKIFGSRGGFHGDEITVDYRDAFALNIEMARSLKCQV